MSFTLPAPAASQVPPNYVNWDANFQSSTSISVVLPSGLLDGDEVWVQMNCKNGITAAPSGYTLLGSATQWSASNTIPGNFSIYRHVWHTGDPTTVTFTQAATPNTVASKHYCFIVRCSGTISVVTDSSSGPTASTTPVVGPWNPTHDRDMRLWFYVDGGSTLNSPVPASPASPTDSNPSRSGPAKFIVASINNPGATSISAVAVCSVLTDPSPGLDGVAGTTASPTNGLTWFTRTVTLSDGTSTDPSIGTETAPGQADSGITADGSRGSDTDALNAAKGRYVGGARLL